MWRFSLPLLGFRTSMCLTSVGACCYWWWPWIYWWGGNFSNRYFIKKKCCDPSPQSSDTAAALIGEAVVAWKWLWHRSSWWRGQVMVLNLTDNFEYNKRLLWKLNLLGSTSVEAQAMLCGYFGALNSQYSNPAVIFLDAQNALIRKIRTENRWWRHRLIWMQSLVVSNFRTLSPRRTSSKLNRLWHSSQSLCYTHESSWQLVEKKWVTHCLLCLWRRRSSKPKKNEEPDESKQGRGRGRGRGAAKGKGKGKGKGRGRGKGKGSAKGKVDAASEGEEAEDGAGKGKGRKRNAPTGASSSQPSKRRRTAEPKAKAEPKRRSRAQPKDKPKPRAKAMATHVVGRGWGNISHGHGIWTCFYLCISVYISIMYYYTTNICIQQSIFVCWQQHVTCSKSLEYTRRRGKAEDCGKSSKVEDLQGLGHVMIMFFKWKNILLIFFWEVTIYWTRGECGVERKAFTASGTHYKKSEVR